MAVRLLFAVVLGAVLFHLEAAVEGEKAAARTKGFFPYPQCGQCKEITRELAKRQQQALSPANKALPIGGITGIAENVCRPRKEEADWMLRIHCDDSEDNCRELVVKDEEERCNNAKCTAIKGAFLEVMKGYIDIAAFIGKNKPSIEELMEYLCKRGIPSAPSCAEGEEEDAPSSRTKRIIKKYGCIMKKALKEKVQQITKRKSCKNLEDFYSTLK